MSAVRFRLEDDDGVCLLGGVESHAQTSRENNLLPADWSIKFSLFQQQHQLGRALGMVANGYI